MIDPNEIELQVLRHQPGGQHVGMRTGVVAIHTPTGIAAVSENERSQFKNREAAIKKLNGLVFAIDLFALLDARTVKAIRTCVELYVDTWYQGENGDPATPRPDSPVMKVIAALENLLPKDS